MSYFAGKEMQKSILQSREEAERKTAVENENDGKAHKLLAEAAECHAVLNHSKHRPQISSTPHYLKQYAHSFPFIIIYSLSLF